MASFLVSKKLTQARYFAMGKAVSDLIRSLQQYFKNGAIVISQKWKLRPGEGKDLPQNHFFQEVRSLESPPAGACSLDFFSVPCSDGYFHGHGY